MPYRCAAHSRDGFVHYLVTSLICRGYWFYVTGRIPEGKDAESIDHKLIAKYDCAISKAARWRRKKLGKANVQYLRCGRFFMLIATKGEQRFFQEEASIRDIRKTPLKFSGYSISFRRDGRPAANSHPCQYRVHVRIEHERFKELVAEFEGLANRLSADRLAAQLYGLPYQGYAPVRRQLCVLLRLVNRQLRKSGLGQLPKTCLFLNRNAYSDHRRTQLTLRSSARTHIATDMTDGNRTRRSLDKGELPVEVVPLRRRIVKPFAAS